MLRKNIEFEVQRLTAKILSQKEQIDEIQAKSDRLAEQARKTGDSLVRSLNQLQSIGMKEQRRDGKPETPSEVQKRETYNEELYKQKLSLVRQICLERNPKSWEYIESVLPNVLKEENLPL